jgi:hypothetical protein
LRIVNEEKLKIKQAPETREDGIGKRDKQGRHESQEDRKEQRFVGNILETNTLQTSNNNQTENKITEHQGHGNKPLEEIIPPIPIISETANRNFRSVLYRKKNALRKRHSAC